MSSSNSPAGPVLFLLGPTASGKTTLACKLSEQFPLDIVSVDSALVYRGMNIGTAKPNVATLAKYPHHSVDLITPAETYSAADFRRDALTAIHDIHAKGRTPILVGGTMMYVRALIDGLSKMPASNSFIRKVIEAKAAERGWPAMHSELSAVDAKTAARLSPNDRQRIQRALEVYAITGTPLSALQTRDAAGSSMAGSVFPFISTIIALMPSARTVLHERIATRFGAMLDAGLIEEVRTLRESYLLNPEMPSMRCVGYRQVWQHLEGEIDTRTMREQGIAATRQLAKRQMTWLRSMSGVESFNCLDVNVDEKVAAHLGKHIIKLNGS